MSRYDGLGRRESVGNSGTAFAQTRHNIYAYNNRNELTGSERKEGTLAAPAAVVDAEGRLYEYDPIGNRINSAGGTDPQVTYARNAVNQYTALTGGVNASPAYDDDGNMTGYDGNTYTWNAENRLTAVETADKKITFLYDYMGRRVRKQVYSGTPGNWNTSPDETRVFVYDGWNLIRETVSGAASGETYYVWGLDLSQGTQGAGGIGGLLCSVSGGEVRRYAYDANGNVGQLVDEDGVIVARYEYDPFGNEIVADGDAAAGNPFRFSMKYLDAETGLYYYGFRYYSAELGRWISRDPLEEYGGYNIYGFVSNNPLYFYDYLGLCDLEVIAREIILEIAWQKGKDIAGDKLAKGIVKFAGASVADGPVPIGDIVGIGLFAWDFASASRETWRMFKYSRKLRAEFRRLYSELSDNALKKLRNKKGDCCNQFAIDMAEAAGAAFTKSGRGFKKKLREGFDKLKGCCGIELGKSKRNGRTGKQARLRELMNDDKLGSADRGWLKNDDRHVKRGDKPGLRLPRNGRNSPGRKAEDKGYELAHPYDRPASQGNSYRDARLKNYADHKVETRLHKQRGRY
ncbi:hypothetical protein DENIS_4443 [Desulfonema ishimotonii]|uniref:Uncharacterized protein n=1 Tax=Desulfonema ishimotonii TaxID=45657 RepID=A0A401G2I0_9BACT|nr:hypothetical protein DENIS_4443 [Desulfonema ishimotonii]